MRALVAVAKATNFKPDKHMLIAAAILLPAGILNGRKHTEGWQEMGEREREGMNHLWHLKANSYAGRRGGLCCSGKNTSTHHGALGAHACCW